MRKWMGTDDVIDPCSGAYGFGKGLGRVHQVLTVVATAGGAAELEEAGALAEGAEAAIDPNKLNHIFGKAEHNLDSLVSEFGSQDGAYNALQQATQAAVRDQRIKGVFETTIRVGSETVTVRGNVIDGITRIGTAFK